MTRIGASQVFFNIVAQFNAEKLIKDYRSVNTVMKAVSLDTFEAILKPIEGLGQAINTITDELNPLQEALGLAAVEFEKFFGSTGDIGAMRDEVVKLGEAFNITAVEALAAGSRAAQVANIIGRGNVDVLMKLAFTLAEISDLNAEEAQRGIIQLHQQTGMLFGELNEESFRRLNLQSQQNILVEEGAKALDALNTIANRSVALEGDLVRVMGTFAAQGELVGDSFQFMAAASAVLLEAGEEQGTAGRALRMMYARLGGDISGARTEVERMTGTSLMQNGEMKSMEQVLTTLAPSWREMSGAQKQNVAQTIAGNRHYVRFIKLMENYDRTIQLTTDGQKGFDSALGQSNYALRQQVNELRRTQNEVETLKAEIGEGLTPFMQGQVDVQKDYLTVTHALTDGLGPLGEVLGRLKGTMEVMGGFIKVGLATQSLGIGMEMFTSVQRQLNGILVANEHLHSKSANFLKAGEKATASQRDILLSMQFIEQKINANAQERKWLMMEVSQDLAYQDYITQRLNALDKETLITLEKHAVIENKVLGLRKLKAAQAANENNMSAQRTAMLVYDSQIEGNMLEKSLQLYAKKSMKEAAMKKQYLADMAAAANLEKSEIFRIEQRHAALTRERDLLQSIKSVNANTRAQGIGTGLDQSLSYNMAVSPDGRNQMQMQAVDREFIAERLMAYSREQRKQFDRIDPLGGYKGDSKSNPKGLRRALNRIEKTTGPDSRMDALGLHTDSLGAASLATKVLSKDTNDLTGGEFKMLQDLVIKLNGELIGTHQALDTIAMQEKDVAANALDLVLAEKELLDITTLLNSEDAEAIALANERLLVSGRLAPSMRELGKLAENDKRRTEVLIGLKGSLSKKVDELTVKEARHIQTSGKDQIKLTEDTSMATRQFGFAMNNTLGMLSGMIGGAKGASISLAFMSSNLIGAGGAAASAAKKMFDMQKAQTLAILKSKAYTGQVQLEKLGMDKANIARSVAVVKIGMMVAAYAALGLMIYYYQKDAEKTQEKMQKLNEEALNFENIMAGISREKKIMDDDTLAEAIGLDSMTTGEMLDNGEDIDAMIKTLQNTAGKYTDQQNVQIENALVYLNVIKATNDEMAKTLNDDMFSQNARDAVGELESFQKRFKRGTYGENFDFEAGQELFDSIDGYAGMPDFDHSFGAFGNEGDALRNMSAIVAYMEANNKLTQEQLYLAEQYFNDTEITNYLRKMNGLVKTQEISTYNQKKLTAEIDEFGNSTDIAGEQIKNLVDEIYSFSGARDELFFGGKYGNVTGSLYRTVVKQGVGTLYHKNEVIMTTNFHGFFNEKEAADRIQKEVKKVLANQ